MDPYKEKQKQHPKNEYENSEKYWERKKTKLETKIFEQQDLKVC
jgi:hypothetical protein